VMSDIIAAISVVVAIFCTWWGIVQNRKFAMMQETIKKPKAEVLFMKNSLSKDCLRSDKWIVVLPGEEKDVHVVPLSFMIKNNGTNSINGAILTISASETMIRDLPPVAMKFVVAPGVISDSFKRSLTKLGVGNINQLSYFIPSISPNSAALIMDMFVIDNYLIQNVTTTVQCKDKKDIPVNIKFNLFAKVDINLILSDAPTISHTEWLSGIIADSSHDAIDKYIQTQPKGFTFYYYTKLMGLKINTRRPLPVDLFTFMEFEIDKKFNFGGKSIYVMKPEPVKLKTMATENN